MIKNVFKFIIFIFLLLVFVVMLVTIIREIIIHIIRYIRHFKNQTTDFLNNTFTSISDLISDQEWLEDKKKFKISNTTLEELDFFVESFNDTKGEELEEKIIETLNELSNNIHILKNAFVPRNNSKKKKYEVDILVVDKSGIYIIESKNYSGLLYGEEKKLVWKCYYTDGRFYTTTNPIITNNRKINSLEKYLDYKIPRKYFKSYIVFGDKGKFKLVNYKKKTKLLLLKDLKKTFKEDIKEDNLTKKQLNYIFDKIIKERN